MKSGVGRISTAVHRDARRVRARGPRDAAPGQTYAIGVNAALSRLQTVDTPLTLIGSTSLEQSEATTAPGRIGWTIADTRHEPLSKVVADLGALEENRTRIAVHFTGADQLPPLGRGYQR